MKHINLSLPEELLVEVSAAAVEEGLQRTEFIRRVLEEKVKDKYPQALEKAVEDNFTIFLRLDDS